MICQLTLPGDLEPGLRLSGATVPGWLSSANLLPLYFKTLKMGQDECHRISLSFLPLW